MVYIYYIFKIVVGYGRLDSVVGLARGLVHVDNTFWTDFARSEDGSDAKSSSDNHYFVPS